MEPWMLVAAQGTQLRAGFRICGATTAAMHGTGTAPTPSLAPQSTGMLLVIQCPQILSVGPGKSSRLSPGWCFPHSLGLPGALLCLQQDQGSLGGCGSPPPPAAALLGTSCLTGNHPFSSMRPGAGKRRSRWFFHCACQVETTWAFWRAKLHSGTRLHAGR